MTSIIFKFQTLIIRANRKFKLFSNILFPDKILVKTFLKMMNNKKRLKITPKISKITKDL